MFANHACVANGVSSKRLNDARGQQFDPLSIGVLAIGARHTRAIGENALATVLLKVVVA